MFESLLRVLKNSEAEYGDTCPQRQKWEGCVFKANLAYIARHLSQKTNVRDVAVVKHLPSMCKALGNSKEILRFDPWVKQGWLRQ